MPFWLNYIIICTVIVKTNYVCIFAAMVCPQEAEADHEIQQDSDFTLLSNFCPGPLEPLAVQFVEDDVGSTPGTSEKLTTLGKIF